MRVSWRLLACIGLIAGCARGTASVDEADSSTTDDWMSLGGQEAGSGSGDGAAGSTGDTGDDDAGSPGGNGGNGPGPDEPTDGGDEDPTEPDSASPDTGSCSAPSSCEAAAAAGIPNVGSVEWAETTPITTKNDSGNHFYVVSVTGDSASEVVKGGIEAKLSSPPGSNYDVYVYGGAEGYNSGLDTCEEPVAGSDSGVGGADSVSRVWAAAAFGVLSDRAVTVEVRHVSGPCEPYRLELVGRKE